MKKRQQGCTGFWQTTLKLGAVLTGNSQQQAGIIGLGHVNPRWSVACTVPARPPKDESPHSGGAVPVPSHPSRRSAGDRSITASCIAAGIVSGLSGGLSAHSKTIIRVPDEDDFLSH
jgi:hypothetical protein